MCVSFGQSVTLSNCNVRGCQEISWGLFCNDRFVRGGWGYYWDWIHWLEHSSLTLQINIATAAPSTVMDVKNEQGQRDSNELQEQQQQQQLWGCLILHPPRSPSILPFSHLYLYFCPALKRLPVRSRHTHTHTHTQYGRGDNLSLQLPCVSGRGLAVSEGAARCSAGDVP